MTWSDLRGHASIVEQFRARVARGRLASTFLFVGPAGVGKRTFAVKLAQALLCPTNPEARLEACGRCESCQQVAAGSHPDLEVIAKPADKSFIPLELLIGDREHRMQEGLCHRIALKPFRGGRKIAIIDDADHLNLEGANCLLKTLEEPPPKSVLILIGTSEQRQLPTIRSRCQVVRFGRLSREDVVQLLLDGGHCSNREEAEQWAELGEGSIARALAWSDPSLREFRERLLAGLADRQVMGRGVGPRVYGFHRRGRQRNRRPPCAVAIRSRHGRGVLPARHSRREPVANRGGPSSGGRGAASGGVLVGGGRSGRRLRGAVPGRGSPRRCQRPARGDCGQLARRSRDAATLASSGVGWDSVPTGSGRSRRRELLGTESQATNCSGRSPELLWERSQLEGISENWAVDS